MREREMVDEIVVKGRRVSRTDVEQAMALCDQMGQAEFLAYYGFGPSTIYWLRGPKGHRPYPSKAILAVAARCTKRHGYDGQFFGGAAHAVGQLNKLGFQVREGNAPVKSAGVDALRARCIEAGFDDPTPDWDDLAVTPVAVFASGTNTPKMVRCMASVRMDVGVTAHHVSSVTETALRALAGTDVQVFVDSGAFSAATGQLEVVKPIAPTRWRKILALYKRLGDTLGSQLWVVAPDQVGSQEVTLERLATYAPQLAEIANTGATIMVVAQKGVLTQADFYRAALKAAGLEGRANVVPALPCKKAATSPAETAAFVRDLRPDHVHCLGLGPANRSIGAYTAAFAGTETTVSLDSCWLTANTGRKPVRRYTKAREIAGTVLAALGRGAEHMLQLEVAMALCLGAPLPALSVAEGAARLI